MSNRFERAADKKTVEKHQKILKDMLQLPENKICADCKKRDPRWASANLGIFICLRCSGIHRSLGVHISKCRSVDLDTWTQEHIDTMVKWGNARANKYWEANLPSGFVFEDSRMESFIRNKYEYKKFCAAGPIPDPSTLDAGVPSAAPVAKQQAPPVQQAAPVQQQSQGLWADFAAPPAAQNSAPAAFHQQQSFSAPPQVQATPALQPVVTQVSPSAVDMKSNIMSLYGKGAPAQSQFGNVQQSQFGGMQQQNQGQFNAVQPQMPGQFNNGMQQQNLGQFGGMQHQNQAQFQQPPQNQQFGMMQQQPQVQGQFGGMQQQFQNPGQFQQPVQNQSQFGGMQKRPSDFGGFASAPPTQQNFGLGGTPQQMQGQQQQFSNFQQQPQQAQQFQNFGYSPAKPSGAPQSISTFQTMQPQQQSSLNPSAVKPPVSASSTNGGWGEFQSGF